MGHTYALVVDNLDDGGQTASEGRVAMEEDNAADLDQAPVGGDNACFTHSDRLLARAAVRQDTITDSVLGISRGAGDSPFAAVVKSRAVDARIGIWSLKRLSRILL